MNTRSEYTMAYRAMRRWWKLVDSTNSPAVTPDERSLFKNIVDSYDTKELKAAMESIQARRQAEYYAEFPAAERASRRRKSEQPYSLENLPY